MGEEHQDDLAFFFSYHSAAGLELLHLLALTYRL